MTACQLKGAHMANADITPADAALFDSAKFDAAALMWYHPAQQIALLREVNPDAHLLVRLPDSKLPDGRVPSYVDYAHRCVEIIKAFYAAGVRDFQLDNEPNLLWGANQQWPYQWFAGNALREIRGLTGSMKGLRIGFPGLSYAPDGSTDPWLTACKEVAREFDFVGVHSYWQAQQHVTDWHFGGNAGVFHGWMPQKPVIVTEWGNSACQENPAPDSKRLEEIKVRDYPVWLAWARTQYYIEAHYLFLIGGTQDWWGFRLTDPVAQAISGS